MSNLVNEGGHLPEHVLNALKGGALSETEIFAVSEHMSVCRVCAGKFAGCFREDELLEVPSGFRDDIMDRLQPVKDDKRQLFFYSIRVAVAACVTLIFVFSGTLNFIADMDSKIKGHEARGLYFVDTVNTGFQVFSQKILDLEVFANENEKK